MKDIIRVEGKGLGPDANVKRKKEGTFFLGKSTAAKTRAGIVLLTLGNA